VATGGHPADHPCRLGDHPCFRVECPGNFLERPDIPFDKTMALTIEDVKRVAHLARIAVTEAEAQEVLGKLTGIFGLIEDMRRVDTTGIAPMSHAADVTLELREDAVTEPDRHELYQSVAPATADGLYLVPKVIE
jgi:aspartyl-tRNA(Asn)/glutamyl-tRNA(Gln) amidotransferase subunit C